MRYRRAVTRRQKFIENFYTAGSVAGKRFGECVRLNSKAIGPQRGHSLLGGLVATQGPGESPCDTAKPFGASETVGKASR